MTQPPKPPRRVDVEAWRAASADHSGARFAQLVSDEAVLEGSVFAHPIAGRDAVWRALQLSASLYDRLVFTRETASEDRIYFEWDASAFGLQIMGLTALIPGPDGRIVHVGLHHAPFGVVMRFSAELGDRLTIAFNGRNTP